MAKEKNKHQMLLFKDFRLEQIAFEVRYIYGNYYPDKLLQFWEEIQNQLTGQYTPLKEEESTIINYNDKFEIRVSADRFAVIQFFPDSSIKELLKVSQVFFDTTIKILEIKEIKRVGLRSIYTKDYDNPSAVAEALFQTPYINYPDDLYLIENSTPFIPNLALGWQNEEKGISYRLNGKSEIVGITLPLRLIASGDFQKKIEKTYNQVLLDIDIYVHKPILPGQFFSDEWINQAYDTVRKEGIKFFGEK